MAADPLAGIKIWPITVTLGGKDYTIPATSAVGWLEVLLRYQGNFSYWDIVPDLLPEEDQEDIVDRLLDGGLEMDDIRAVALDALTEAGGRPWWWTVRLLGAIWGMWDEVFGQIVGYVDLNRISLAGFTSIVYAICVKGLPKDKQQLFDMDLNAVPEGHEQPLDEDDESAAFMRMMQQSQQFPA